MHRIPILFRKCGIPYVKTCTKCKAASIYLFSTMPGPSLLITTHAKLQKVLQCFTDVDITAYTFLTLLLNEPTYNDHPSTKDLLRNSSNLFATFLKHPKSSDKTWAWASNLIKRKYSQDIRDLADIESGWHFSALKASEKKLTAEPRGLESRGMSRCR
jgi:hypothetical protein